MRHACFGGEYNEVPKSDIILYSDSIIPQASNNELSSYPEVQIELGYEEQSESMLPIISCDLSTEDILTLNNTTAKKINASQLLMTKYDFGYIKDSNDPLVLIIHTHATECYSRENSTYYDPDSSTRSNDEKINMIAVGKVLADTLNNSGINTLHCTVQHDAESYRDSYPQSAKSIKEYLQKYPSIRYVLDIHRDAVMYESGAKVRAVTEIEGKEVAQIMLLSGTNAGGADFPHWESNLSFALRLADKLSCDYPDLLRPIAVRGASYNQQYTTSSLLIEIGTDGNTLTQAKNSAVILGNALAKLIKGE